MRFEVTQRFVAPVDEVIEAYLDPAFYESLVGTAKIDPPELVDIDRQGSRAMVRVRHRLVADLPRGARSVIDPDKLSWVEHTDYDLVAHTAQTRLEPDHYADRLSATAESVFAPHGDGSTRVLSGELTVRMRLVGGRVEQAIVNDLTDHLRDEAVALDRFTSR